MIHVLLIIHFLAAVMLIGALTHQLISIYWHHTGPRDGFLKAVRGARSSAYPSAVVVCYLVTFTFACMLYPDFRVDVRSQWDIDLLPATGAFEIKEHFGAIGLGVLPAYWVAWRSKDPTAVLVRRRLTAVLAILTWCVFLLGHVLNNIEGLS